MLVFFFLIIWYLFMQAPSPCYGKVYQCYWSCSPIICLLQNIDFIHCFCTECLYRLKDQRLPERMCLCVNVSSNRSCIFLIKMVKDFMLPCFFWSLLICPCMLSYTAPPHWGFQTQARRTHWGDWNKVLSYQLCILQQTALTTGKKCFFFLEIADGNFKDWID